MMIYDMLGLIKFTLLKDVNMIYIDNDYDAHKCVKNTVFKTRQKMYDL